MRKIFFIIISIFAIISFSSCRRTSDNGKIDGYWQIREIHYNDGQISNPNRLFICVNLELMQLNNPDPSDKLTGVISYHRGDDKIGVDFRYGPTAEQLALYGFAPIATNPNECILDINRLDSKYLVLTSPIAVITCKRF